ncbi:MAG: hypothetical protein KDK70_43815, partial [Myxococcales bacterium]|nr:hypothetical protein [Myxococcales bacterium]
CLRVHSAQGSDAAHVEENVAVVWPLPAAARGRVALAARDAAHLCSAEAAWQPDDSELLTLLTDLGVAPAALDRLCT